ncbi:MULTISPECIES: hypothetical protein [Asaia]|uniref:hypothetical protein n=1 Tax=Asaia TaxID=91914 RepID=UPI002FC2E3DD
MSGTGRIPLMIQEVGEAISATLSYDPGRGALLRLVPVGGLAGKWLVSRDVAPARASWMGHTSSCACCAGQNPLLSALNQLFLDRVRGQCPSFSFVVILCADNRQRQIRQMLESDVLAKARYIF